MDTTRPIPNIVAEHRKSAALRWADTLGRWQDRARERRALMALGDRELKDFGLCRSQAWVEFSKPFWRD